MSPETAPAHDRDPHVAPRAYATPGVPGIGGRIKVRPEDFLVDEQPLYTPSGKGEHIYMLVQKRNLSTLDMVGVVARHFGVDRGCVGYAGLKDKHAITRQVVSVHTPGKKPEDFPALVHERLAVLWTDLHENKLRPGHLRGNRFSVRIRDVRPTDVLTAKRVLDRLRAVGVPNRVGEQRFGMLENNHIIGRAIVANDFEGAVRELLGPSERHPEMNPEARRFFAEKNYEEAIRWLPPGASTERRALVQLARGSNFKHAILSLDKQILGYYLSSFQSAVFNRVLDARVIGATLGTLRAGDVAMKLVNQAPFLVDEATAADPATAERLRTFEISPSGPMWGSEMMRASGATDEEEVAALAGFGVTPEMLDEFNRRSRGSLGGKRRPLRVPLIDPEVEGGVDEHGAYVRCAFELPRGSFATVVLREVMKPAAEAGQEWEEG